MAEPTIGQRYPAGIAHEWMAQGLCPECGHQTDDHTGWGLGSCSLTDNGVAQRIEQYRRDQAEQKGSTDGSH